MKKIGREVLFLETGEGNPRNGEGTFARLKDGSILFAYTEYYGEDWADEAIARISAVKSYDEGETWTEPYILLEKDDRAQNYMSPSLVRLSDGGLGMIFLRKENKAGGVELHGESYVCMPVFSRSDDEGDSWSDFVYCIEKDGYYCAINDGAFVSKDGIIYSPMSSHADEKSGDSGTGVVIVVCSDDCGKSWRRLEHKFVTPFPDYATGLEEPGLYEHENGDMWMYCRTIFGNQYESRSVDGGKSWSSVRPNLYFTSPNSPMRVKKLGKYTVAVFNPAGATCLRDDYTVRGSIRRTPLVCAVSDDDGRSFDSGNGFSDGKKMIEFSKRTYLIEDSRDDVYCYPAMIEVEGGFLAAYYHSNGGTYTLCSTKITKVSFDEIK